MSENKIDLYNNPMVDMARKAMTPEQLEEYKRMGEYMYNNDTYKITEMGSKITACNTRDCLSYAVQSLRSGLDPFDLTEEELQALISHYGRCWYREFDYQEFEVPKPVIELMSKNPSRQERRLEERKKKKAEKKRG